MLETKIQGNELRLKLYRIWYVRQMLLEANRELLYAYLPEDPRKDRPQDVEQKPDEIIYDS